MIRASILGADSPLSGELIRILAMHPDVELVEAQARGHEGIPLSDVHHGLIGETSLQFSASVDFSKCDVLFIDAAYADTFELAHMREARPDMKIIFMRCPNNAEILPPVIDDTPDDEEFYPDSAPDSTGLAYGLPEMNRKQLVRGATVATLPSPFASMALVALFPFARHLMLRGDIKVVFEAPAAIIAESDLTQIAGEITGLLREVQQSFQGNVEVVTRRSEARRSSLMTVEADLPVNIQQALNLYEIYDDHRFAFVTTARVGVSEVAGTDKCVVMVGRDEHGCASISAVADCRMRGGAGEAVHIMNLMFGLHEKTGLYLKAIDFDRY